MDNMEEYVYPIEDPVPTPEEQAPVAPAKKSPLKNKRLIVAIACVAVVLVIGIVLFSTMSGPDRAAEKYVKAYMSGDFSKAIDYYAYDQCELLEEYFDEYYEYLSWWYDYDDIFEYLSDEYDEDFDDWDDFFDYMQEDYDDEMDDYFGDYKIITDVTKSKERKVKWLKNEYEYLIEELEEYTDFDIDDVSAVQELTVKVKIDGDDDTEKMTVTVIMVKMGLSWKVFYSDLDFDIF